MEGNSDMSEYESLLHGLVPLTNEDRIADIVWSFKHYLSTTTYYGFKTELYDGVLYGSPVSRTYSIELVELGERALTVAFVEALMGPRLS